MELRKQQRMVEGPGPLPLIQRPGGLQAPDYRLGMMTVAGLGIL